MLIKFELENFRSVRDAMSLSLTAVNYYKERKNELISEALPGLTGIKYLRAAALFGPNASGKSTIFQALETMRNIVMHSASITADATLPYAPYLLDEGSKNNPTYLLAAFTSSGVRYEYSFAFTAQVITEERLCSYPKGREQVWFTRKTEVLDGLAPQTEIKGSAFLKIPAALRPLLNDNALLLSLLANYPKFEGSAKVRPVVDWFAKGLAMIKRGSRSITDYPFSGEIVDGAAGSDFQRSFIQEMMRKADVGINQAKIKKIQLSEILKAMGASADDPELAELMTERDQPQEYKTVVFEHQGEGSKVEFDLDAESEGTFQLFSLSGHIAQALESGSTLLVDEIDASLHPILVREVIRCFLDPKSNPHDAQLIFTAHNPCLLEEDLLRRDQIWLTEKSNGATELYPLSDFSPLKNESLVSGYLLGRYSATPLVPACFGRCGTDQDGGTHGE